MPISDSLSGSKLSHLQNAVLEDSKLSNFSYSYICRPNSRIKLKRIHSIKPVKTKRKPKKYKIKIITENCGIREGYIMFKNAISSYKCLKRYICSDSLEHQFPDNTWLTGGPLGAKECVLVFRTCLLRQDSTESDRQNEPELPAAESQSNSNSSLAHKVFNVQSQNESNKCDEPEYSKEQPVAANDNDEKQVNFKKRPIDSMSSSLSDQSLSSVCGDTTEIESVIQDLTDNPPQSTSAEADALELSIKKSKSIDESISKSKVVQKPSSTSSSSDNKENAGSYCKGDMPGALLGMTYRFHNTETRLLRKILSSHGLTEVPEDEMFNLLWTGVHIKPDILRNLVSYQRVNHFPRSYELTRKDTLHKNIEKMQHLRGFKHFDIVPLSFILPNEYRDLVSAHNKNRGPWIVKPVASSRGRGIFIVNSPDQIPHDEHVVVAKYIADPLCIDGHKCDIRLYVAVTSFDPLIIYLYEEGLVRIATVKYDREAENLWNPCMHLCNYSINKYHSDYIKSNDANDEDVGHKWTMSALLRHLKSQGCDTQQLMLNIEDVIIKAIMSCTQPIVSACRMFVPNSFNCFELYGFDILIDDSLKPWLLEINLSPSLGIDTPLDAKVKASLMSDLLTIVGMPATQPINKTLYESRYNSRMKGFSRRSISVDYSGRGKTLQSTVLTSEEVRIIKHTRSQYARRGGFVRIFPVADSIQKYGMFLDPITGIPTSTPPAPGTSSSYPMVIPHNYNVFLHANLYPNGVNLESRVEERITEYERALDQNPILCLGSKSSVPKCTDEARRLRKHIRKQIEGGSELSQLQARKTFGMYLEFILRRLSAEPKHYHEKLILKFIQRTGAGVKTPNFIRDAANHRILSKDRGAIVAKQLGDYLTIYNRETESFFDSFDRYGMIPIKIFKDFLSHADESDLESILTLHTNVTRQMPFLYNHCALGIPPTPPIPTGQYGFLKALPSMVPSGIFRDDAKIDSFYKSIDSKILAKARNDAKTADRNGKSAGNKLVPLKKKVGVSKVQNC